MEVWGVHGEGDEGDEGPPLQGDEGEQRKADVEGIIVEDAGAARARVAVAGKNHQLTTDGAAAVLHPLHHQNDNNLVILIPANSGRHAQMFLRIFVIRVNVEVAGQTQRQALWRVDCVSNPTASSAGRQHG